MKHISIGIFFLSIILLFSIIFVSCDNINTSTDASTPIEDSNNSTTVSETLDVPHATAFTVSNVFASDMVLQRNEYIRVWGYADDSQNGRKVSGEFMGMFAEAMIENGEWVITFDSCLEASAELGNTMKIYADGVSYEFENVLVGDVYMVMGQSNCAYSVAAHHEYVTDTNKGGKDTLNYDAPIRIHYNSQDQVLDYPKWGTTEVCKEIRSGSTWQRADSYDDIKNFTAIGYFFAQNYLKLTENKVPIGLIEIDGTGRPLGAFMCNEVADEKGTDKFDETKGYYVTTGVNGDAGRYLYNNYMYPFERYALAGLIWYQGESDMNAANVKVYAENFSALMTYMRSTHNLVNKDFPVYYIEFPTIYKSPAGFVGLWQYMDVGVIRAAMGEIQRILPNSHQVVSTDLWSDDTHPNNLHPNCKYEQSERLSLLAAIVNGESEKKMTEAKGPVLVSIELMDGNKKAILTYENVGDGLKTTDGGNTVNGFSIYRKNGVINPNDNVTATITAKNQITVESTKVIKGIAYNAKTTNVYGVDINLCNSFDIPAGATVMLSPEN